MNIANEIVSHALRTGELQPFLDAGFDQEFLRTTEGVVFFGLGDRQPYEYLLRHYAEHGSVPLLELFQRNYPEEAYRLSVREYKAGELAAQLRRECERLRLTDVVSGLVDLVDSGDYEGARARMAAAGREGSAMSALPFRHVDICDLDSLADPVPLIDGIVEAGSVARLTGFSGTGKSFIALDWGCCVASGADWLGHPVTAGKVLYVAAEGARGLKRRAAAWQQDNCGLPGGAFEVVIDPVQFGKPGQLASLIRFTEEGKYDLVIIDTQARCTVGLEENSAKDMGSFVDSLYKLRDAHSEAGTTVLVVHHTGYDLSHARGSTAAYGAMDAEFLAQASDPHDMITLSCKKQKDGEPFPAMYLSLEQVRLPSGKTSCVVAETEPADIRAGQGRIQTLTLVQENPGITAAQAAVRLGVDRTTVARRLKDLESEGKVLREQTAGNQPDRWHPAATTAAGAEAAA